MIPAAAAIPFMNLRLSILGNKFPSGQHERTRTGDTHAGDTSFEILATPTTSLVRDSGFCVYWFGIGELQPETHHFFVAGLTPTNGLSRIGILRIIERIVK